MLNASSMAAQNTEIEKASVGSDKTFKETLETGANAVTGAIESGISSINSGATKAFNAVNEFASDGGEDASFNSETGKFNVDSEGNAMTGIASAESGGMDLLKLAVLSITDPLAAAKQNPYWDSSANENKGGYDKSRDVDGDGLPDYDSNGKKITFSSEWSAESQKIIMGEDGKPSHFKVGHDTYKFNSTTGQYDKYSNGVKEEKTDGTSGQKTEFEQMVEEEETKLKSDMAGYMEEAKLLVANQDESIKGLLDDPEGFLTGAGLSVSDSLTAIDADQDGAVIDSTNPNYGLEGETPTANVNQVKVSDLTLIDQVTAKNADTYDADTVTDSLTGEQYNVDPITGKVSDESLVDGKSLTIDMEGSATGVNSDGTKNYVGEALKEYETQNISNIIDTSTVSGKLLAQELGEGNYTDTKATMLGQLEILSKQFVDQDGNPKIPTWCQALSRNVSRNIAFTGMSGSGALAAMCTALMESTLPVAEADSGFFKDLTIRNLTNRQETTINKAKVLSNFEMTNVDTKTKAAIQNAEAFLKMDTLNLTIQNEAEVINTQTRVTGLFEDQKAVNAQRLFTASEQNKMDMFYDNLSTQAEMFVAEQVNNMKKFNVGELNDNSEFNASLQTNREQFIANMQFNIDTAIAEWKQNVILTEYKTKADAASQDAKNLLGVKLEVMNQLWDEADMLLDYVVKIGENDKDRQLALAEIAAGKSASKDSIWSSVLGAAAAMGTKFALTGGF
jgi:hypothetical protein